jgi:hypothetical protein
MAVPQLTIGKNNPYLQSSYARMAGASGGQFMPFKYPGPQISGGTGIPKPGGPPGGGYYHPPGVPADQQGAQVTPAQGPSIDVSQFYHPAVAAYTPDYSSMIGGSWEVSAAESAMASQMAAARSQFQNQLRQSFIDLGYSGDMKQNGLGDFSKYIDKDTIQKAIDNKYSAYSQIKQQEEKTNAVNDALLASSGLSLGGTTTATATDTINQAEQARYEGLRNFLSGGQQGLANLTNLKLQLAQGVEQARFAAAQRLAQMYPPTPAQPEQYNVPALDSYISDIMAPVEQDWANTGSYLYDWMKRQGTVSTPW